MNHRLWLLGLDEIHEIRTEMGFIDSIDAGAANMVDFGRNDMMPHFIYCYSDYYYNDEHKLKSCILKKMQKYGIQSSILTALRMDRANLISKEKSKQAAEGKLKNDRDWKDYKKSINDDLESFVNKLRNSGKIGNENVRSFLLSKLSEEELELVEQGNSKHKWSYLDLWYDAKDLKKSDSNDKYVRFNCRRKTFFLTLESGKTSSKSIKY